MISSRDLACNGTVDVNSSAAIALHVTSSSTAAGSDVSGRYAGDDDRKQAVGVLPRLNSLVGGGFKSGLFGGQLTPNS